jgi:CDGSH-type Zn-finger protein
MATKVTIANNGPLLVDGDIQVVDQEGKVYGLGGRAMVAFCRCGCSENKPFCDGAHKKCNFQSSPHAHDLPPPKPKV